MTAAWESYCNSAHAAAHPAPQPAPPPDLLDFCFALGGIEIEVSHLARLLGYAAECDAQRGPTLRAHLAELRDLRRNVATLVAEAELETA